MMERRSPRGFQELPEVPASLYLTSLSAQQQQRDASFTRPGIDGSPVDVPPCQVAFHVKVGPVWATTIVPSYSDEQEKNSPGD